MRIEPPPGEDNLSDYLLFRSVMGDAEACECLLSTILDEPDLKLKEVQVEKVISSERGKRSVRLDNPEILVKDERIVRLDRIVTEFRLRFRQKNA